MVFSTVIISKLKNTQLYYVGTLPTVLHTVYIDSDIFVNCNWIDTRWQ